LFSVINQYTMMIVMIMKNSNFFVLNSLLVSFIALVGRKSEFLSQNWR